MNRGMALSARRDHFRFWGLLLQSTNGGPEFGITEVELRATVGGADVTTSSTPATATSTFAPFAASSTVDNSTSTYWRSTSPTNQRLAYDLGVPTVIRQVAIYPYAIVSYNPNAFVIQGSHDGVSWVSLRELPGLFWTAGVQRTFSL